MKKEKNAVLAIFAALKIWPPEIVGEEEIFLGPQKGFLEFLPIFFGKVFFYFFRFVAFRTVQEKLPFGH